MSKLAADFEKIIHAGRERKKNEALANRIFSKDRRQSAPSKLKPGTGPSLASRVGVKKAPRASLGSRAAPSSGNIDGEWTHDLHRTVNGGDGSLASRISGPGVKPSPSTRRRDRLAGALDRMDERADAPQQVNVVKRPAPAGRGLTIKGLAGPFAVMAQNFAPGTTVADIESAMTPVGGEMDSCRVIKTQPIMLVEMVFASREGGERVIETFNDKTADGRLIKLYPKIGGQSSRDAADRNKAPANAPSGPRDRNDDQLVDGTMGFPDLIRPDGARQSSSGSRPLYSDRLVGGGNRGRGFGRRGRGGR